LIVATAVGGNGVGNGAIEKIEGGPERSHVVGGTGRGGTVGRDVDEEYRHSA
jgi:hypothetical protein